MIIKNKYPRFFISELGNWDPSDLYVKIDKPYGDVYTIRKNNKKYDTSWTESACDSNVKRGYWREIREEEAALL